jgi:hypothetical protein
MNLSDCKTTAERDVVVTYRRHLKRKGATPFTAQGSALAEELKYGAGLSPNFVEAFTDGTRTLEAGRLRLTPRGREALESALGINQDPELWHYWSPSGDYVRAACGLVRNGLKQGQDAPPAGAVICPACKTVSTVEREVIQ